MKPIEYRRNELDIEVRPGPTGIATIYDKEVVLLTAEDSTGVICMRATFALKSAL